MEYIKHANDLDYPDELSRLIAYVNSNVECRVVKIKIRNKDFLLKSVSPKNDFIEYNYCEPGAEAQRLKKYN